MRRERGSIRKRGNSYSIVVEAGADPVTGKRRQKWITVKGTKRDAERKLTEVLHSKDTGSFVPPAKIRLSDYLEKWLAEYAKPRLSVRSYERYSDIIHRDIIPQIGRIQLSQLLPGQLQALYAEWLDKGLSSSTVNLYHNVIHNALRCAVKWGMIGRNVCDALEVPRERRPNIQVWNEDEVSQFLEYANNSPYYEIFYLALFSGMRRGEILALRWADVDLITGQVHVSRGLQRLRDSKLVFTQPKSERSRRTIALPPSATLLLKEYRDRMTLERAMNGKVLTDNDLVFCRENGKPIRPDTITYAWAKLVKDSGLKRIRLHDTRHTHASLMLAKGIHPKIVQERLGHSSITMTLDTYNHVIPGLQEAAAKSFDSIFTTEQVKERC